MAKKAELKVKITGDKTGLDKTLDSLAGKLASFAKVSAAAFAAAGTAAAVGLAVGIKNALDLGSHLVDLSAKTGIAADQIMVLQQAAKDAGLDDMTGKINKMQKALVDAIQNGTSPAAKAFDLLGLSAYKLIKQSPVDQIEAIGEALRKIKSPELKTSAVRDIFGKSGTDTLSFFSDPKALEDAQKSIGRQAQILKENAKAFDDVSDRLGRAPLKLQGFFVGVTKGVLPQLEAATAAFDQIDLAAQGEKFGDALNKAIENFKSVNWSAWAEAAGEMATKVGDALAPFIGALKFVFPIGDTRLTRQPSILERGLATDGIDRSKGPLDPRLSKHTAATTPQREPFTPRNTTLQTGSLQGASMAGTEGAFIASVLGMRGGNGAITSVSPLNRPAFGQTDNLLSLRERRRNQNLQVANGASADIRASTANAYHVVRSGDKNRAQNVARQRARDEASLVGVNAKLTAVVANTKETADALK